MNLKSLEMKKKLLIAQLNNRLSQSNERQLELAIKKYFKGLREEVLDNLEEYWSEYQMLQGHIDLIIAPIENSHNEYYHILEKHNKREYQLGQSEAKRLINITNDNYSNKSIRRFKGYIKRIDNLFGTIQWSEEDLLKKTFIASKRTLSRITSDLNQIITEGYTSGKGINIIASMLTRRFDQLETWEARRIARTEIHNSHNTGVMRIYEEVGVEYTQWIAAGDDRVRESHVEIDGEIIQIGDKYSNGLSYPGDTSGPIEEWINCRCSHAEYIIPLGYEAPNFYPFTESDLIKVGSTISQDYVQAIQDKLYYLEGAMMQAQQETPVREIIHYEELIIGIYNPNWTNKQKQEYINHVLEKLPSNMNGEDFLNTLRGLYPNDKYIKTL